MSVPRVRLAASAPDDAATGDTVGFRRRSADSPTPEPAPSRGGRWLVVVGAVAAAVWLTIAGVATWRKGPFAPSPDASGGTVETGGETRAAVAAAGAAAAGGVAEAFVRSWLEAGEAPPDALDTGGRPIPEGPGDLYVRQASAVDIRPAQSSGESPGESSGWRVTVVAEVLERVDDGYVPAPPRWLAVTVVPDPAGVPTVHGPTRVPARDLVARARSNGSDGIS